MARKLQCNHLWKTLLKYYEVKQDVNRDGEDKHKEEKILLEQAHSSQYIKYWKKNLNIELGSIWMYLWVKLTSENFWWYFLFI